MIARVAWRPSASQQAYPFPCNSTGAKQDLEVRTGLWITCLGLNPTSQQCDSDKFLALVSSAVRITSPL